MGWSDPMASVEIDTRLDAKLRESCGGDDARLKGSCSLKKNRFSNTSRRRSEIEENGALLYVKVLGDDEVGGFVMYLRLSSF
ncbi:hypothetical protein Scep_028397 [Stephania cephalantha]|uniref:Uncharacterized protein n=1 Tax=Stephania cephalantha TaxID=152367 RepID=A0AAP0EC18_9MAGN